MDSSMPQAETVEEVGVKTRKIKVATKEQPGGSVIGTLGIPFDQPNPIATQSNKKQVDEPSSMKLLEVVNTVVEVPVMINQQGSGYEFQQAQSGNVMINDKVHLNLHLGEKGSLAFLSIRNALRFQNVKFPDGKPVFSNADTIRWLVDQVANQV